MSKSFGLAAISPVGPASLFAALALAGCDAPVAKLPDPSRQEAVQGLARLLKASNVSFSFHIGPDQPTRCQPGKLGDAEVRSCKVCAQTFYRDGSAHSFGIVLLKREEFDIAFKRGQSFEQPDISPADTRSGVWVAIVPEAPPYAPAQIPRAELTSMRIGDEQAAALIEIGGRWRPPDGFMFIDRERVVPPPEVFERLIGLPRERIDGLVGSCTAKP